MLIIQQKKHVFCRISIPERFQLLTRNGCPILSGSQLVVSEIKVEVTTLSLKTVFLLTQVQSDINIFPSRTLPFGFVVSYYFLVWRACNLAFGNSTQRCFHGVKVITFTLAYTPHQAQLIVVWTIKARLISIMGRSYLKCRVI